MTGSNWKTMSAADWQTIQQRLLGTTATRTTNSAWHTRDVVLLALAVALAAGLIGLLLARRPRHRTTN